MSEKVKIDRRDFMRNSAAVAFAGSARASRRILRCRCSSSLICLVRSEYSCQSLFTLRRHPAGSGWPSHWRAAFSNFRKSFALKLPKRGVRSTPCRNRLA